MYQESLILRPVLFQLIPSYKLGMHEAMSCATILFFCFHNVFEEIGFDPTALCLQCPEHVRSPF